MYAQIWSRRMALVLLLAALTAPGCGKGRPANTVAGKVYVGGKEARGGTVAFLDAEGNVVRAAIGENGNYRVAGLAPGAAKVGVVGHARVPAGFRLQDGPNPGAPAPRPEPEDGPVIPARYKNPDKSGLTYEVRAGEQEHDIKLDP